jgi:hypothetical protein
MIRTTPRLLAFALVALSGAAANAEKPFDGRSEWASLDATGKLSYKALPGGDRIMDFSFAGYRGGGVALPTVPVRKTLRPSGADDTAAIQAAIDEVSKLPASDGFRGVVLLEAGTFQSTSALTIKADGVVLRGSGSGAGGTTLMMTGKPHVCISLGGSGGAKASGEPVLISDRYVPSGTTTFSLADATGFKVGDPILVTRPTMAAWVKFMGMDALVRNGKKETWVSGDIQTERAITAIAGNKITLDIPLSDSLDAALLSPPGASVAKCAPPARVARVGVESLRIVSPAQAIGIDQPQHQALRTSALEDGWLRDLAIVDTVNSVSLGGDTRRVTVENVRLTHSVATVGAAKPADFTASGSQILFHRCSASGSNLFYFVTGARATGPNVLLDCAFEGGGWIQPHARWATGLLVDGCKVSGGGIDFMNRGQMGTGHGWTIGWAVAWNCVAKSFTIQQPPGAMNWAIGCIGERKTAAMPFGKEPKLPEGIFDSHGTPVAPASLYLAQLRARLGEQAVKNIGH